MLHEKDLRQKMSPLKTTCKKFGSSIINCTFASETSLSSMSRASSECVLRADCDVFFEKYLVE